MPAEVLGRWRGSCSGDGGPDTHHACQSTGFGMDFRSGTTLHSHGRSDNLVGVNAPTAGGNPGLEGVKSAGHREPIAHFWIRPTERVLEHGKEW